MNNKKGQAAMEFLMTYGWAILVVLAAIGALAYFGVLSPGNLLPERTVFKAPFGNTENAYVHMDGSNILVQIPFINNFGSSISLDVGTDAGTGTGDCSGTPDISAAFGNGTAITDSSSIPNGEKFTLNFTCAANGKSAGDKFKTELSFDYTTESGITRPHTGQVDAKILADPS